MTSDPAGLKKAPLYAQELAHDCLLSLKDVMNQSLRLSSWLFLRFLGIPFTGVLHILPSGFGFAFWRVGSINQVLIHDGVCTAARSFSPREKGLAGWVFLEGENEPQGWVYLAQNRRKVL